MRNFIFIFTNTIVCIVVWCPQQLRSFLFTSNSELLGISRGPISHSVKLAPWPGRRAAPSGSRRGERAVRNPIAAAYLPIFLPPPCGNQFMSATAHPLPRYLARLRNFRPRSVSPGQRRNTLVRVSRARKTDATA